MVMTSTLFSYTDTFDCDVMMGISGPSSDLVLEFFPVSPQPINPKSNMGVTLKTLNPKSM